MDLGSVSSEAAAGQHGAGAARRAQDQQKAEGEAAVRLIQEAGTAGNDPDKGRLVETFA